MKFSLCLLYFHSDRVWLGAGGTKKKLLDYCGFCANWRSESENLLTGVNFYSYFPNLLSNLSEIRYKWSVGNVVGRVRVQWKLVQGRLHLSYERKWNTIEACAVNPTTFESKGHLGKFCVFLKGIHVASCVTAWTKWHFRNK